MRGLLALSILSLPVAARAQLPCEPLDAAAMQALAGRAQEAINTDDLEAHAGVWEELKTRIPCLDGPIATAPWTEFLVGLAVVRYAMGRDWQPPLQAAVLARPDVPREYGPAAIRQFVLPEPTGPEPRELVADADYWLDGVPLSAEPPRAGLHILQRRAGGSWTHLLLDGTRFPDDWLITPPPSSASDAQPLLDVRVTAVGGVGQTTQRLASPNPLLQEPSALGPAFGISSWGALLPADSVLGVTWDVALPVQLQGGPVLDAWFGPTVGAGALFGVVGGGVSTVQVADVEGERTLLIPQPHVGGGVRAPLGSLRLLAALGAGYAPPGTHAGFLAALRGEGATTWTAGLDVRAATAFLVDGRDRHAATVLRWRAGLFTGIALGRQRAPRR